MLLLIVFFFTLIRLSSEHANETFGSRKFSTFYITVYLENSKILKSDNMEQRNRSIYGTKHALDLIVWLHPDHNITTVSLLNSIVDRQGKKKRGTKLLLCHYQTNFREANRCD